MGDRQLYRSELAETLLLCRRTYKKPGEIPGVDGGFSAVLPMTGKRLEGEEKIRVVPFAEDTNIKSKLGRLVS